MVGSSCSSLHLFNVKHETIFNLSESVILVSFFTSSRFKKVNNEHEITLQVLAESVLSKRWILLSMANAVGIPL